MNKTTFQLTKEGFDDVVRELKKLKEEKLPKGIERVAIARSFGDLSENAEYHSAREDLAFIEGKVQELENIIRHAVVLKTSSKQKKSRALIDLGSKVTVENGTQQHIYFIVGEWEAKPAEKKISHQSPLGKALLGKKVGDTVEFEVPAGKVMYSVVSIE